MWTFKKSDTSFGSLVWQGDPQDDPARWRAKEFTDRDLCKRYGCTSDDLVDWKQFGFPQLIWERVDTSWNGDTRGMKGRIACEKIFAWEARVLEFAAAIPKRK